MHGGAGRLVGLRNAFCGINRKFSGLSENSNQPRRGHVVVGEDVEGNL